ncbi:MAG: hypothetical protein IPL63_12105 [Saprospiraceae bacterium]|nr:hypothetical protein [Saprospiraceae bacterium]MBK8372360.1 hypothetical protein [Saprospiraceae bacterium]MBK8548077.1 hypothetical protein [Saprospiraceae bacterium]
MTTVETIEKEARRHNSSYSKVAVQWLNQAFASTKPMNFFYTLKIETGQQI